MSKKLQLTIPKPCHEDWEAMTPEEKGRFCGSCQKQVIDFSVMSDRQLAEFFKKPSTGSVCGRFMTDQLDRDIDIPKKRMPWVKYFFQFTIPAFLVSLKTTSAKAQVGKIKVETVARDTTKPVCRPMMGMVARPVEPVQKGLKGNVVDAASGLPLPLAKITLVTSAGSEAVQVNNDGSFLINYVRNTSISAVEFTLAGYQSRSISWLEFLGTLNGNIHTIKLQREMTLKGEIAVNTCRKPPSGTVQENIASSSAREADIKGSIVDEENRPVPYASILSGNPLSFIIADENGQFLIPFKSIPQDKLLNVSAAGFENAEIMISKGNEAEQKMRIVLKAKVLDEVVVTSIVDRYRTGIIAGAVTRIAGDTIKAQKKETVPALVPTSGLSGIKLFPNPLPAGNDLSIEWKGKEEGYFMIQITDLSARLVHQQEIWIDAEAKLLSIGVPSVAAGNYVVIITNKKTGKQYSEKLVIQ